MIAQDSVCLSYFLHVLVKVLQRLIVLFQILVSSPSVRQVQGDEEDAHQNSQDPSFA